MPEESTILREELDGGACFAKAIHSAFEQFTPFTHPPELRLSWVLHVQMLALSRGLRVVQMIIHSETRF
jgi:hypothetical protein